MMLTRSFIEILSNDKVLDFIRDIHIGLKYYNYSSIVDCRPTGGIFFLNVQSV